MKEDSLFCFVLIISLKPHCFRLCYWIYHQKVLDEHQFGLKCLELWCGLYQILNQFFIEFSKKTKIENYIGIWGHSWYY
jgi:hypothetical protein